MAGVSVDSVIERVLGLGKAGGLERSLTEAEMTGLLDAARESFLSQPPLLELGTPIKVCGDTHGQYPDLLRLFNRGGFPPAANYLFLGDYVDRGKYNLETISLLLAYKLKYPGNLFLLRGNHECALINRVYGFLDECSRRYSPGLWQSFNAVFNCMPFAAVIETKILCMHGGISPQLGTWAQVRGIQRPVEPAECGLLIDLLWADPDANVQGWRPSPRGVSYLFGPDALDQLCKRMNIDLIARAHQVPLNGYEFFAARRLVTLFSAPHYCGEFDNAAAFMTVNKNLLCYFDVLRPSPNPRVPTPLP